MFCEKNVENATWYQGRDRCGLVRIWQSDEIPTKFGGEGCQHNGQPLPLAGCGGSTMLDMCWNGHTYWDAPIITNLFNKHINGLYTH